jgi:dihydrolipoamide dehydrogenase
VTGDEVTVTYEAGGEEKQVVADYVLVTVGRRPNTNDIGLENIGVKMTDRGLIEIDRQCRTSVPNIYAIGDIVAGPALAHKASYEGKVAAEAIAGLPSEIDYKCIPAVVFSDPEIAGVGLSEAEAVKQGIEVAVGKFNFAANGRALSLNAGEGFVKLVADKKTGLVLGGQIAGPGASDLIAEIALAVEMGATLEDIALTIHAHPTLGEVVMETAEVALGHPIHAMPSKK